MSMSPPLYQSEKDDSKSQESISRGSYSVKKAPT